ncbi:OmpA family protein [Mucilaginibacter sp.]|uniref:OmpA family protein n=1 Tax=Mucilaginibacter sp. TaxID=1882438 RepID=UPI003D0E14C7
MKPLKILITVMVLGCLVAPGYAQILKPGEVAKDAGTSQVNSTETSTIDNGVNKAAGAIKGLFKKKKAAPAATTQPAGPAQNAPAMQPQTGMAPQQSGQISAYNNYDFVPGDQIVFDDSFADDQNGEFPAHWNLGKGQAVVNTIGGRTAFLLTDGNYAGVSPLIKSASYLGDTFTIEFDDYCNGGYLPKLYFYSTTAEARTASNELGDVSLGTDAVGVKTAEIDLSGNLPAAINGENYLNKWHHIAIAFKNNQLKVYVDQYRVLVVPNLGVKPHAFDIEGIGDAQTPIIISNVRAANGGGMNMLGKKFTDAKLITHGINFDIDKATIKPESMGTLNMVAGILKDNPDLKFEIDGHTDNSGTAAHNATLSQQRADAVKAQLTTMGIDAARLTTKGFGDTKPMSDNTTPEGKANNRRVEFVKQ